MGKRAGRTTGGGKGAYRTMKIAVLMDAPLRATLLSEKTMARLAEWGEVAVNETDTVSYTHLTLPTNSRV